MTTPPPNDCPRELLAAYVDGELDAAARAAVERWLAEHPTAFSELQTQRDLSPANAALWERAEPPEPSEAEWVVVRREIEHRLTAPFPARRWRAGVWTLAGLATAGIAAAVAWVAFGPVNPPPPGDDPAPRELVQLPPAAPAPHEVARGDAPRTDDPLAGLDTLTMATDNDVVLDRVPEFPAGWLPVGRHPLQGILALASEEELRVAEFAPSSAWPLGGPRMTTAPGDAPMIYVARLK
jgi:hypothetical protein